MAHKAKLFATTLALAGVLAASALFAGTVTSVSDDIALAAEPSAAETPTITVTANSEIAVVPDKAQIGVAVTTQAKTAADTQTQNAEAVNALTDALHKLGIEDKSIQTAYTYLNPRYDYSEQTYTEGVVDESEDSSNIVGYEMTTGLTVKDLDIDKVGEVLRSCVAAGANNADGIQYYSSEYDAKYDEALAEAVKAARAKAEVLAKAAEVKLGGVFSIVEGYQNTAYRYDNAAMGMMEAASAEEDSLKVSPGEINIDATVTVTFEIA